MPFTTFDETGFSNFWQKQLNSLSVPLFQLTDGTGCCGIVMFDSVEPAQGVALATGSMDSDIWQLLGIWTQESVSDAQRTELLQKLIGKLPERSVRCLTFPLMEKDGQGSPLRPVLRNAGFSEPEFEGWVFKLNTAKAPKDLFEFELSDKERRGYEFLSFAEIERTKNCLLTEVELPAHPEVLTPFKSDSDKNL